MNSHFRSAEAEPVEPQPGPANADMLRQLFQDHGDALWRSALRLSNGDPYRADDIIQETALRAWRRPEARNRDGAWSRPWLFAVAHNVAIDMHRAASRTDLVEEWPDKPTDGSDPIESVLEANEVRAAVAGLPDRLRDVLVEVFLNDRSGAEAAKTLGIPVGTVKSRTYYALRELRVALVRKGLAPS